jgi:hypothetical protein
LAITWQPGLQGIVDLSIAIAVLCGTVLILLAVNNGIRLGFLLGLTALFGWLTLMFFFWMLFPIAYKGPAPSWKVKEVTYDIPNAATAAARDVPLITKLPDAQSIIDADNLQSQFKGQEKKPTLGDVIAVDPSVEDQLKPKLNGWHLLPPSNKNASESMSAASEYLVNTGKIFPDTQHFVVLGSLDRGGKPPLGNTGMWNRITHKIESIGMWFIADNPTHYAVVQVQASNYTEPGPGQKPPVPEAKAGAPVITVIMVRDLGALRLPAFALFVLSLIIFAICLSSLHRRDKMGMAARAAAQPKLPAGGNGVPPNGSRGEQKPAKEPESAGVS